MKNFLLNTADDLAKAFLFCCVPVAGIILLVVIVVASPILLPIGLYRFWKDYEA